MANTLNTGASALIAFQRAIATTANNISNVNTEGYSRQRVDFEAMPSTRSTIGSIGQGVRSKDITRITDQFANERLLNTRNEVSRTEAIATSTSRLDKIVGTESLDLSPALSAFFSALHDANSSPDSIPARAVVISAAQQLEARFNGLADNFRQEDQRTTKLIKQSVENINGITKQLASINYQLNINANSQPLHLLDQRDKLLQDLSAELSINYNESATGSVDVFIGNGASLIMGNQAFEMSIEKDPMAPHQLPISLKSGSDTSWIGAQISGGTLSGLNDYRQQILDPAINDIGRIANVLTGTMNQQHQAGIDLNGNFGSNLYNELRIPITEDIDNTGNAIVSATFSNLSQTEASSYELGFDGIDYTVTRLSDGKTFSNMSPMTVDGITIEVSNTMNVGDRYIIAPTQFATRDFSINLTNPESLALSSALRVVESNTNTNLQGTSNLITVDPKNEEFSTPVEISFSDTADNYNIINLNDGTILQSNVSWKLGDQINQNGWSVTLNSPPSANDAFRIEPAGARGDNINGMALVEKQNEQLFSNVQNLSEKYAETIATIGAKTLQASGNFEAAVGLNNTALEQRDSVSGVNLDEEAISLTRYQQAYQASAKIITVAEETFQTLISALGR